MSCFGMLPPEEDIEAQSITEEEYFCHVAMDIYHKKTSIRCSPELKPYLLRVLDYSRHNGEAPIFDRMRRQITPADEKFLMGQVNKAVASALKDQKKQIEERYTKKNTAMYIGIAGLACTIVSTGITLAATLSDCKKN